MSEFRVRLEEQLPRLMRYALALTRDSDQAVDLIEDTLREALAQEREGDRAAELRVWLLTILHEQHDNPFRHALTGPAVYKRHPVPTEPGLSRFDRALGQLPEEQRAVILLIGLEGMSYDDTGAILRISAGTLRTRLQRGRESLCRSMGAAGRTDRPARTTRPDRRRLTRAA